MSESYDGPLPEPTLDSQPYWAGLKENRLLLQRCSECGVIRHYARPMCSQCHSMKSAWVEASGRGHVHSWTVTHHPFHPAFKESVPYVLVTVDLEESVRMLSQLRGAKPTDLRIGLPVEVFFEAVTNEVTLPFFRLLKSL
jgi:uncharacterized OB-fold protein